MKFGDKLILLRKKHGLSQEELASKLNVSRQSVSKWESNNTYPETDKIIQICNIFECRMDDLINDKVNDVEQVMRKNKNNLSVVFDSLLEFITKSINMFTSMKFSSGLRCIIELGILVVILFGCSFLISEIASNLLMGLVRFLPETIYFSIYNVVETIIEIALLCFSVIIIVHVFKIRYLDFYDKMVNAEKNEDNTLNIEIEDDKKINKDKEKKSKRLFFNVNKEPKIIIRDKHTTFAFLTTLSKIIVGIFKAIASVVGCCLVVTLIAVTSLFVISLFLTKFSVLFLGIDLGLVGIGFINVLFLIILTYFIINKKINFKNMFFMFLGSVILIGIGIGVGCIGITEFNFVDNMDGVAGKYVSKELMLDVKSNMIVDVADTDGFTIKIDDNMSNDKIKVVGSNHEKYFKKVNSWTASEYGMKVFYLHNSTYFDFSTLMNMIYDDLEDKIFRSYYVENGEIEVVCNSKVAKMLLDNAKKSYLVDYEKIDGGYKVGHYKQKIYLEYNCEMEYDARNGKYSYDDSCSCTKEERMSPDGQIIDFDCKYISE